MRQLEGGGLPSGGCKHTARVFGSHGDLGWGCFIRLAAIWASNNLGTLTASYLPLEAGPFSSRQTTVT